MDKKQLEHLSATKAEIRLLTCEIMNFPEGLVTDYYYDYPNGEKRVRPLIGYADCSGLKRRLQGQIDTLNDEIEAIENYLATVEDTEMRAILRMKYRNDMTSEQIGKEMGYEGSTIRKKLNKYWRENK
jgi:hypothetical protein